MHAFTHAIMCFYMFYIVYNLDEIIFLHAPVLNGWQHKCTSDRNLIGGELGDISGTIIWWNEVSVVEYSNQHRHIVLLPTSCVVGPSRYKFHEILMVLYSRMDLWKICDKVVMSYYPTHSYVWPFGRCIKCFIWEWLIDFFIYSYIFVTVSQNWYANI